MKYQKVLVTNEESKKITQVEKASPELVKTVVMVSPKGHMSIEDWRAFGINFLIFSAPTFAIFFQLLANGVPVSKAWPVAVFGLYQSLADYFTKLSDGPKT